MPSPVGKRSPPRSGVTEARSVLDVGCAEGWFLRRAAEDFGCFAIGIDGDDRRVSWARSRGSHDGVERVAVMKGKLSPEDIGGCRLAISCSASPSSTM